MEDNKVTTTVKGFMRWDGQIDLTSSRRRKSAYTGGGERKIKPSGIDKTQSKAVQYSKRMRLKKKWNSLDLPLEQVISGEVQVFQLTINNCSQEKDRSKWLRASEIVKKLRRRLEYIYGYSPALLWCGEFGTRYNKPHVHILIFLPTFYKTKPEYKYKKWDNGIDLLEYIGLRIIQKSQHVPFKSEPWIAKAKLVHRETETGYVAAINETLVYFSKIGAHACKASHKSQDLESENVYMGGAHSTGYSGVKKKEVHTIVETTDEITSQEIMEIIAENGWCMGLIDKGIFTPLAAKMLSKPSKMVHVIRDVMKAAPESDWIPLLDFGEERKWEVTKVQENGGTVIEF